MFQRKERCFCIWIDFRYQVGLALDENVAGCWHPLSSKKVPNVLERKFGRISFSKSVCCKKASSNFPNLFCTLFMKVLFSSCSYPFGLLAGVIVERGQPGAPKVRAAQDHGGHRSSHGSTARERYACGCLDGGWLVGWVCFSGLWSVMAVTTTLLLCFLSCLFNFILVSIIVFDVS